MVDRVAVVGAGTMGVGIAYVFAAAGYKVALVEPDEGRFAAAQRTLADAAAAGVQRGKLDAARGRTLAAAVERYAQAADLPVGVSLAIESVPERAELKGQVLRQIAARGPQLIATNTSSLSVNALAASVNRPETFLGMHFFNPVWSLPLVELVRGAATSEASVARARAFAESVGKTTIVVEDTPGFATSRLDLIAALEAIRMLQDGVASAADIDKAMVVAYRHPVGPLRLSDIVGLDVRLDIARQLARSLGPRYAPPRLLEEMVERGELGRKSGKGFFDWPRDAAL
ncbi:MAG: 3-hydroxybutyryl-CoA dehydrogenase [Pseudomonadota bacterium]|nr:3-hydroxybutyryl-CoA dehydrogenase [Pseudomonadota bacterium]